ncbi:hypothetical protein TNCV_1973981 [Trichonephila clavipes]|nr:hypothetical protein TNCV_1973981 [Trichonephila clavipes]
MAAILNLTTSVIEVIRRTLDAIHNATNQDLHLITPLIGPVMKTKTCDLRGSYTRAFGDGPRNFEPWSSDVDDT